MAPDMRNPKRFSFFTSSLMIFSMAATCAAALMNLPSAEVVAQVRTVAEALGLDWFADVEATPELEQRYYDRFFAGPHPAYVPLCEDSVRSGYVDGDRFRYGSTNGRYFEHALRCYQTVGFDYRLIEGYEAACAKLKADSLASELAFLAFLAQSAVDLGASDPAAARRSVELFEAFVRDHASRWFGKAAERLAAYDDDFYAKVALWRRTPWPLWAPRSSVAFACKRVRMQKAGCRSLRRYAANGIRPSCFRGVLRAGYSAAMLATSASTSASVVLQLVQKRTQWRPSPASNWYSKA